LGKPVLNLFVTVVIESDAGVAGGEKTIVFVGEKGCGKSSLISKFLDEPLKDDMKETTALEYKYGTRVKD